MHRDYQRVMAAWLFVFTLGLTMARAETQTWTTATGDWSAVANWTNWASPAVSRVPEAGDDVFITNAGAYAILTNSTPWLSSLVISNSNVTMSFSNWDTTLYVTNLTICQGATQTCVGPFTNTAVSNRVNLACSNLVIESGGAIDVGGKGYSCGFFTGNEALGHGPGGWYGGGSYGGAGAFYSENYGLYYGLVASKVYGLPEAPLFPGSGGFSHTGIPLWGGYGGGAICITANQVVVNGGIKADGTATTFAQGSGGSGGGIFITCSTITGTNGTITAKGGNSVGTTASYGGEYAGGGGRIAVIYNPAAQSNLPVPSISFSVLPGWNYQFRYSGGGDLGTLYFPDNYFFSPTNLFNCQWMAPGLTNLSLADWTISNVWIRLSGEGLTLTVTNTLAVIGTNYHQFKLEITNSPTVSCGQCLLSGAMLGLGKPIALDRGMMSVTSALFIGPTFNCSGNLTLTNSSQLHVSAGNTNTGLASDYGALINVSGDVRVYTNSWIYPATHPTNGAVVLFNMCNLTLNAGGGINADCLGYIGSRFYGPTTCPEGTFGPGSKAQASGFGSTCGSGYGGAGGRGHSATPGGQPYGSSNAPIASGSGAYRWSGSDSPWSKTGQDGGGSVQIRASQTVTIQGMITANGKTPITYYNSAGASGGGIYITCRKFIGGSNGVLRANGGNGLIGGEYGAGGGGGGRIAVWRMIDKSPSVISNYVNGGAAGGTSILDEAGTNGTVVWGWLPGTEGTVFSGH